MKVHHCSKVLIPVMAETKIRRVETLFDAEIWAFVLMQHITNDGLEAKGGIGQADPLQYSFLVLQSQNSVFTFVHVRQSIWRSA